MTALLAYPPPDVRNPEDAPATPGMADAHVNSRRTRRARVGVCVSGSLRTFELPCVGPRMVANVIRPLDADVFVSINVPRPSEVPAARSSVASVLTGSKLIELDVHAHSSSNSPCAAETGYPQTLGLARCGSWMLPRNYTWIVRLRTDTFLPFALLELPPAPNALYGPAGAAITDGATHCQCSTGQCAPNALCQYSSDQFALLAGRAQRTYLLGFGQDFCEPQPPLPALPRWPKLDNSTGRAVAPPSGRKLGWSLASRHVPVRDIRFAGRFSSTFAEAVTIIRRPPAGSPSCTAAGAVQSLELRAETIAAIPTGAFSESRRRVACGPPHQRPKGWAVLCAGSEPGQSMPPRRGGGDRRRLSERGPCRRGLQRLSEGGEPPGCAAVDLGLGGQQSAAG